MQSDRGYGIINFNVLCKLKCGANGMTREKVKFSVEPNSFGVQAMVILLALSIVFRVIGCWGLWTDRNYLAFQICLPILSALLMILFVWLFGRRALWITVLPVFLGVVFFIIKSLGFESQLHTVLCILLYILVLAVYFCTVFAIFKTKWFLVPLFGLPFLYHVFVEDLAALRDTANPVSFADGMQEMGVLCIMLGLLFLSLSMKKTVLEEEVELPKIKPPKVMKPGKLPEQQSNGSPSEEAVSPVSDETLPAKAETPVTGEIISTIAEDSDTDE